MAQGTLWLQFTWSQPVSLGVSVCIVLMLALDLEHVVSLWFDFFVQESISCVFGFSKETLVAIITNIEGREWQQWDNIMNGWKPEYPRASSTDDVECFFSVMRDSIGGNFTTKEVKPSFRKICTEFTKHLDPNLPFFYHTSSHTCYYEGPLPDFTKLGKKTSRKRKRVPRREQPAAFAPRCATMPVRGSLSVRPQFHNLPLPLPTGPVQIFEHSYAQL